MSDIIKALPPISLWPDPILKTKCVPVEENVSYIVDDLFEVCELNNGAGLAAPQIGVSLRLFVTMVAGEKKAYINPEIKPAGEWVKMPEACLSFPGFSAEVKRRSNILVRAWDVGGRMFEELLEGFESRVVQHEYDHLDGIMFFDHLKIKQRNDILFRYGRKHE